MARNENRCHLEKNERSFSTPPFRGDTHCHYDIETVFDCVRVACSKGQTFASVARVQTYPYSFGCHVANVAAVDQSLPQM
jgi:hypothetical protein